MAAEMVERVRRAIQMVASIHGPHYEAMARAAIEALRDPTPAMLDSGVAFALNVTVSGEGGWTNYVRDKHGAMIAAALTEADGA